MGIPLRGSAIVCFVLLSGCKRADPPVAPLRPYTPQPTYAPAPGPPPGPQTGAAMGPFGFLLPPGYTFPPPGPGELPWPFDPKYWPAPPAPAPQPAPPPSASFGGEEQRVLDLVNQRRARGAACGSATFGPAGPLTMHPQLVQAARAHSADMGRRGYFSHDTPEGLGPSERAQNAGYRSNGIAENIAAGNATPEETVEQWMTSPGHCGNIMMPRYREMGVGHATAPGTRFTHYWTQMFGL